MTAIEKSSFEPSTGMILQLATARDFILSEVLVSFEVVAGYKRLFCLNVEFKSFHYTVMCTTKVTDLLFVICFLKKV